MIRPNRIANIATTLRYYREQTKLAGCLARDRWCGPRPGAANAAPRPQARDISNAGPRDETRLVVPPRIWIYWQDSARPRVVEAAIGRIRRLHPGCRVHVLHRGEITHWLPDFQWPTVELSPQAFSDLLRLDLLARYGGVWMDASILLERALDVLLPGLFDPRGQPVDFFGAYREWVTQNMRYPMLESWLLAAPANSTFIQAWQAALLPMRQAGALAMAETQQARADYDVLRQGMSPTNYLMVNIAAQQALRQVPDTRLRLLCAEDSAFYLQTAAGEWCSYRTVRALAAWPAGAHLPPIIKLVGEDRDMAEAVLRLRGLIHPDSFLARLLAESARD